MRVEPTGIIFVAQCEIQSDRCTARTPNPITAVRTVPGREQVDVCRACLEEMVRAGEWEVTGARVRPHADLALLSSGGTPLMIVEVKRRPGVVRDARAWATRIHRNLLVHGAIPSTAPFLLAAVPGPFYLWYPRDSMDPEAPADVEIQLDSVTSERLEQVREMEEAPAELEEAVADWLADSLENGYQEDWMNRVASKRELEHATLEREYAM